METVEAITGCLTDCDLGHSRCSCAPAEYAEPSAQFISLHQPSSSACQSTIIHSLEKFAITSSTVNQSNHRNQQYSVIAVTDSSGTITERYSYTAYGEPAFFDGTGFTLPTSQFSIRHTYTGREYDSTIRLYHYRARMYDSQLGRFLGRDPIGYTDFNIYSFVFAQPLTSNDPEGLVGFYIGGPGSCGRCYTCPDKWGPDRFRVPDSKCNNTSCTQRCKDKGYVKGSGATGSCILSIRSCEKKCRPWCLGFSAYCNEGRFHFDRCNCSRHKFTCVCPDKPGYTATPQDPVYGNGIPPTATCKCTYTSAPGNNPRLIRGTGTWEGEEQNEQIADPIPLHGDSKSLEFLEYIEEY